MRVLGCTATFLLIGLFLPIASGADDPYGDPLPAGARMRLGTLRHRYNTNNYTPVVLPDGKTILARDASELRRFDTSGARLKDAVGGSYLETPVAFSADGSRAVLASTVTVFDTASGKTILKLPRRVEFFDRGQPLVDLSADGKVLAVGEGKNRKDRSKPIEVIVHDVETNKEITRIVSPFTQQSFVSLSADGKILATWGSASDPSGKDAEREVRFWNATTGKELSRVRTLSSPISTVEFSLDGKWAAASSGSFIDLIDPKKGTVQQSLLGRLGTIRMSAFSPDGSTLFAVTNNGLVQRWRVSDGQRLPAKAPPIAELHSAGVRVTGPDQAVAFGQRGNSLVVWDAISGKRFGPQVGHFSSIQSLAVSDDSRFVFTSAQDNQKLKWELATGKLVGTGPAQWRGLTSPSVYLQVQLSPTGNKGLISVYDGYAVFDAVTGEQEYVLPVERNNSQRVYFTPDGTKVIAAVASYDAKRSPATVAVWDLAKARRVIGLELPGHTTIDASLTPDGQRLITMSRQTTEGNKADTVTTIWDATNGRKKGEYRDLADFSAPMVVAAGDNATAAVVSKGKLFRLTLANGKMTPIPVAIDSIYQRPVFSRDGAFLAVLGSSSFGSPAPVVVIEWETGKTRQTYQCPDGGARDAIFTPDGKHLITATNLCTALVWEIKP